MHLSTQMDSLLSTHRDFTSMVDIAWAHLMLCEKGKWAGGKLQKVHWDQHEIRTCCMCLLCVAAHKSPVS